MKQIVTSGKRKTAVARVTIKNGNGKIAINNLDLSVFGSDMARMKIQTPLLLADAAAKKLDFAIRVNGGGINSQAEAIALAIARALAKHDKKLEKVFLEYDRQLLVADVRRKEVTKPNCQGKARSKRQKSYR